VASRSTTSGSAVRLWLPSNTTRLLILVQDDSPHRPVCADPRVDAEHGRGLLLVEAISNQWGWYAPLPGAPGKVTWALLGIHGKLVVLDGPEDDNWDRWPSR
jgi:hypothetical protein